jgi:hypothetical protein
MSDTWVTLRNFENQPLAELAKIQLDDAGIPCRLINSEIVGMYPLLGNAVGYIPLQVPEDRLEAAADVLGEKLVEAPLSDCPRCGEPLGQAAACPMCGQIVEEPPSQPDTEKRPAVDESPPDDEPYDEPENTRLSLEGMRGFAKSAISVYLIGIGVFFLLAILAFLSSAMNGFRH